MGQTVYQMEGITSKLNQDDKGPEEKPNVRCLYANARNLNLQEELEMLMRRNLTQLVLLKPVG